MPTSHEIGECSCAQRAAETGLNLEQIKSSCHSCSETTAKLDHVYNLQVESSAVAQSERAGLVVDNPQPTCQSISSQKKAIELGLVGIYRRIE